MASASEQDGRSLQEEAIIGEDDNHERGVEGYFDYGWIKIEEIVNKTKLDVTFSNPYSDKTGTIEPGKSERDKCVGWVPYYDYSKKYTIKFKNNVHDMFKEISIVDLKGKWLMSMKMPGVDEDVRSVRPKWGINKERAALKITVYNEYDGFSMTHSGYIVQDNDSKWEIGKFFESKRDW